MFCSLSSSDFFEASVNKIRSDLLSLNLDKAMRRIQTLVEVLFCSSIYGEVKFDQVVLDRLCLDLAKVYRDEYESGIKLGDLNSREVVIIASKIQPSGGHSKVLEHVIKAHKNNKITLILTNACGSTNPKVAVKLNAKYKWLSIAILRGSSRIERLRELRELLRKKSPPQVYLFNSSSDVVAVVSAMAGVSGNINFVHHVDAFVCLGSRYETFTHVDLLPATYKRCSSIGCYSEHLYLPLVTSKKDHHSGGGFSNGLSTVTVANRVKLDRPYCYRYENIIPKVIEITKATHYHIGYLDLPFRLKVRLYCLLNFVSPFKFKYLGTSLDLSKSISHYDISLALMPFPSGAGQTMIDLMSMGVPLIVHRSKLNWESGGIDLAYEGCMNWGNDQELFDLLKGLDKITLKKHRIAGIAHTNEQHAENLFQEIISKRKNSVCPNLVFEVPGRHGGIKFKRVSFSGGVKAWIYLLTRLFKIQFEYTFCSFKSSDLANKHGFGWRTSLDKKDYNKN